MRLSLKAFFAACFIAAGVLTCPIFAQQAVTEASVTGRVLDPSGVPVPQAAVTATEHSTGLQYSVTTDSAGRYRLPFLPLGRYRVLAVANGFAPAERIVELSPGSAFDLPLQLSMPSANSTVQVIGNPPLIEANRSQIANTVQPAETSDLPYEGRNMLDLGLLLPGVSPTNTASTQTLAETSEVVGQGYSVNSQRNFSNSFVVDGLSDNDDAAGTAGVVFGLDTIREFQVVPAGGQAEFGRALGGYFNIVTRSGTNEVHGTAYGFLRNRRLNAVNPLSHSTLPLTQGIYGFSLSGPIQKDRSFLLGNFEEQRLNTNGIITVNPASAQTINAILVGDDYQAPLLPVGTTATTLYPTSLHTDTAFVRGDHRFSQSDQFSARYNFYKLTSINARGVGGLNEVSNGSSVFDTDHTVAASNVATLSARTFNETRGQFSYDDLTAPPVDQIGPVVSVSGVATFGRSTSSPNERLNYLTEIVDNLVMERGAHTFKVGADFLYNADTITFFQSLKGSYSFACLTPTMTCTNALSTGTYNNGGYTQNFGNPTVRQTNPNVGLYVQHEWKVAPGFTFNAGVRYDLEWLQTIHTDTNNVSPRVGFAWSPTQKTVVRGNYGLFYDRVPLRPLANALLSANNTTDPAQAHYLSYSFSPGQPHAPVFPQVAIAPPPGATPNYALMDRTIQNPYSHQVGLEVEQQLTSTSTLAVSYQHVRGLHLISSVNTNINPDGTRPDPTRGNIKPYRSIFDSYYDGLEVSYLQRPVSWGSVRVSYTWSHAIDDVGEFFFSSPMNNFNLREDRSRSDDDQRQRVVFDGILYSPRGPAAGWVDHLTHGWQLSGILQYYSKLPFNIVTGANTKQQTTQRPCQPGASPTLCAEGLPGTTIGRNAGVGFDFFGLNTRLSRTFAITERLRLQAMAEAFNALNHRNDMIPNATWGTGAFPTSPNANFHQATAVGDPRSVQLGARLSF